MLSYIAHLQVEVMAEDDDEEDEGMEGGMMAMQSADGQQFVVLEVIQLQVSTMV